MQAASKLIMSLAVALTLGAFSAAESSAQAVSTIPTADAQAFVGTWNLPITGDQPVDLELAISDNAGNVAATVSMMGSGSQVTNISKAGDDLVLAYTLDLGGQQAPLSIKLTPNEAGTLAAVVDVADGMFTASGTATKK
jgi:hypothetical protein